MPRITKVYTRTGDDGTTALGSRRRVGKDSLRVECYGLVDELNAALGVAVASHLAAALGPRLGAIQNELFILGSDLCVPEEDKPATPVPRIEERHVRALETWIDELLDELPPLANFVLPGGDPAAAQLHVARTICRRAERSAVALARAETIGVCVVPYLNRLSDALFVAARWQNRARAVADRLWDSRA